MNKDDLIRRGDVLKELKWWEWGLPEHEVECAVAAVPAVEAEPVVHAHWIPCGQIIYGGWNRYNHYCSHCGIRGHTDFKRCPECGAHIDEEVNE